MDDETDMDVLEDLTERYEIRRNQRISTLMDAIDEGIESDDDPDDDDGDGDEDRD